LQEALGELVAHGLLTADGITGLRQMISDKRRGRRSTAVRPRLARRRRSDQVAGRWSIWRSDATSDCDQSRDSTSAESAVEHWAWQLLRRWGVMFRDLLIREPGAPRWFELLRVYRRLEARGEIRGGRFITDVAGEQFALSDTVKRLRQLRTNDASQELVILCAADPLNLVGILTHHARIPSLATNRVAYRDGKPIAALQAGVFTELEPLETHVAAQVCRQMQLATSDGDRQSAPAEAVNPCGAAPLPRLGSATPPLGH
ncbi:MAG: hypothetical protein ABGZ17_05145, partial [Planctomycetaceae bacterium]